MRIKSFLLAIATVTVSGVALISPASGQNATPNYWKCANRIGGSWKFGQAPAACDAASFGSDATALRRYGGVVFDHAKSAGTETGRYMNGMHAVLRDASAHYLRRRKPNVSASEIKAFRRAVLALAHQESYWTHFRRSASPRKLKLMRGDYGHGHGLMQIDDRWHFAKVSAGEAWDLADNMTHALDLYYSNWQRAANSSCVGGAANYTARARAAYSAYNGGSTQLCRWTNTASRWAANDRGFYEKYRSQIWSPLISNSSKTAPFKVGCALDGGKNCFPTSKAVATSAATSEMTSSEAQGEH